MKSNKKAAIELTLGTIVIIVLSVALLILGIVFVKSIMCSGIVISQDLSTGVKNEVRNLFGADQMGVKCVGEGGQEIKYASGGRRQVVCIIKTDTPAYYDLKVDVDSIKGASKTTVQKWVIDQDWAGDVSAGGPGQDTVVLVMDIPGDAPSTTLKLTTTEVKDKDLSTKKTHISYIDVVPTGFLQTTLC